MTKDFFNFPTTPSAYTVQAEETAESIHRELEQNTEQQAWYSAEWLHKLKEQFRETDTAIADRHGWSQQYVNWLRRVWDRFSEYNCGCISYEHCKTALPWDDGELWLNWAEENRAGVSVMVAERERAQFADAEPATKEPDAGDVPVSIAPCGFHSDSEPESTPPPAPPVRLDKCKRPVPDRYVTEYETGREITQMIREIGVFRTRMEVLSQQRGGEFAAFAQAKVQLRNAQMAFKCAVYYSECPRCGETVNKTCKLCSGAGWMPNGRKGAMSDHDRQWLGLE